MRMTRVPVSDVRALLGRVGATVLETETIDEGPVSSLRYYASPV
jgi:hypothetical protein